MVLQGYAPAQGNRLLNRLPADERAALLAVAELVTLRVGQELHRQDGPVPHVYFPTSGMCSVTVQTASGAAIETAMVGNEGMVGIPVFLGLDFAPHRAVAQVAGGGIRVERTAFTRLARNGTALERIVRRYVAYRLRYAHQTVACHALHSVEERACRWLLTTHHGSNSAHIDLTHEMLAEMLGVHRQTVSVVAGTLQRAGLIAYRRGRLEVRDSAGLRDAACECYGETQRLYERIMQ